MEKLFKWPKLHSHIIIFIVITEVPSSSPSDFLFTERKLLVRKDTKVATTTDKYGKHVKITQWLYFVIIMTLKKSKIIFIHLLFCSFCCIENRQGTAWGKQRQVKEISHISLRWTCLYLLNVHVHLYIISLFKRYLILVSSLWTVYTANPTPISKSRLVCCHYRSQNTVVFLIHNNLRQIKLQN